MAAVCCLAIARVGEAQFNYTNIVAGNASIASDIPSTWWQSGTTPSVLIDGNYGNRWLTGNYAPTWSSAPVVPPGPYGAQTLFPYRVSVTCTVARYVTRVFEYYTADGGGFDDVDLTLRDSGGGVLFTTSNVAKKSVYTWGTTLPARTGPVKSIDFYVKKHGYPAYYDVRASEIVAYDDGGAQNFALTATIASNSTIVGGTAAATIDEDIGNMVYGPNNVGGWFVYDLGAVKPVGAFRGRAETGTYATSYKLQIPDGSGGWTAVVDVATSSGFFLHVLNETVKTRYVRLEMGYNVNPDPRWRWYDLAILEGQIPKGTIIMLH
jgi:hypothetical protein